MEPIDRIDVIFWDFDGVLMNSNEVRDLGFVEVLKDYPDHQVDRLLEFHRRNGGLSRYVKFRYFFEEVRKEPISEEEVLHWAQRFSVIMRQLLVDPNLLIEETVDFVRSIGDIIPMHVVSGSDQEELRFLCGELGIARYFKSIHGSPKPKTKWVGELLEEHKYDLKASLLIGDSKNDYEAARDNGIDFMAYNNQDLESLTTKRLSFT